MRKVCSFPGSCCCCPSSFSTPLHPSPALPSYLLGPNTSEAWLSLPTKGKISLNYPHSVRPTYQAGALGLMLGKAEERKRNRVFDARRGDPHLKALQALLSRMERSLLVTGGRKEIKGSNQRKTATGEAGLSQEVNAEIRMHLQPQAPRSEPGLLQGSAPVSCLLARHSFVQETCSEVPRFLSPPFSANAFHTPSLPSLQEIHPWTKSLSLRTDINK